MKKLITTFIIVSFLLFLIFLTRSRQCAPPKKSKTDTTTQCVFAGNPISASVTNLKKTLIGEGIMQNYGIQTNSQLADLQILDHLCFSYRTLIKNHTSHPIGCNGDLADALRGNNPYKTRFLPDDHHAFNKNGEIQDQWGTPLFIHILSADKWDIVSAGSDKKMWTSDDIGLY